jgi:acetylornithine deacetylase/succinyl-diaminopimelate desuccinylase-like protein
MSIEDVNIKAVFLQDWMIGMSNYHFSDPVRDLKPSAIREIFKYAADPQVVSLSAGNPAPEAFPAERIAAITADIFATRAVDALQYSVTEGYPALRRCVGDYLKQNLGIGRDFDEYGGAHQPDEFIECDALVEYAKIMAAYIMKVMARR